MKEQLTAIFQKVPKGISHLWKNCRGRMRRAIPLKKPDPISEKQFSWSWRRTDRLPKKHCFAPSEGKRGHRLRLASRRPAPQLESVSARFIFTLSLSEQAEEPRSSPAFILAGNAPAALIVEYEFVSRPPDKCFRGDQSSQFLQRRRPGDRRFGFFPRVDSNIPQAPL